MHPTNKSEALNVFERYGQQVSGFDQTSLRRARRILAFRHHPDRGGDVSAFQEINIAYDILSRSLDAASPYEMKAPSQAIETFHLLQRFAKAWATLPLYAQTVAIETIGFVILYNRNSLFGLDGSVVSFIGLLIILAGVIRAASRILTQTTFGQARR